MERNEKTFSCFIDVLDDIIEMMGRKQTKDLRGDLKNARMAYLREVSTLQTIIKKQKEEINRMILERKNEDKSQYDHHHLYNVRQSTKRKIDHFQPSSVELEAEKELSVLINPSIFLKCADFLMPQCVACILLSSKLLKKTVVESGLFKTHPYSMKKAFSDLKHSLKLLDCRHHRLSAWKDVESAIDRVKSRNVYAPKKTVEVGRKVNEWVTQRLQGFSFTSPVCGNISTNKSEILRLLGQTNVFTSCYDERYVIDGRLMAVYCCTLKVATVFDFEWLMAYFPREPTTEIRNLILKFNQRGLGKNEVSKVQQTLLDIQPEVASFSQDQAIRCTQELDAILARLEINMSAKQFFHFLVIAGAPCDFEVSEICGLDFKTYEKALWAGLEEVVWTPFITASNENFRLA